ncbi:MAG: formate-dependent phosphoribosylglycinamide formyltransferase [Bradymonadaceae bacterium]|nr:formate-dependent phosphoribosylglycinamide formyltransferase [Lujinxingiaceae bacterium]
MPSISIGTPHSPGATKLMLLGSGELGREVAIEAMRLGVEVVAVDNYPGAPAMQIAQRCAVIDMQDANALRALVHAEKPDFIVPEVESIATQALVGLEAEGFNVIPTARATQLTMDREGIRRLAAEELGLLTSPYAFAGTEQEFLAGVARIGVPCVVKPVMSSSGKGQSLVTDASKAIEAWQYAIANSRGRSARVIVEGFVDFDTEITLLTIRHGEKTSFCAPIGHRQVKGDYIESWQPEPLSAGVLESSQDIARRVTDALGGSGLFGVELFICANTVYFSEVSPRPHDTGMVTMISQHLSEFALHVRAILGLPIPPIELVSPSASHVILAGEHGREPRYTIDADALEAPGSDLRIFAKPTTRPGRRMGVALARAKTTDEARALAKTIADGVTIMVTPS